MEWHWGNIGSALQGFAVVIVAIGALVKGPAVVRAWIDGKRADADEARARAEALRAEAEQVRLERRRTLLGWSINGVETYTTALVTDPAEMARAAVELDGGGPTAYVILRVDEGEEGGSVNRGRSLRMMIEREKFVCRPPNDAEREALDKGFDALGVQAAFRASRRRVG